MKYIKYSAVGLFFLGSVALAAPVSWDGNVNTSILQPLQAFFSSQIKGSYFTATSTTKASTFPYASTTAISSSNLSTGNCLQASTGGLITNVAFPCGSGAGSVTQINTTYPVTGGPITTTGTIALAFGTTTSNTWAGTQTFTNSPVFSTLGAGTVNSTSAGLLYNTSTSTPTVTAPITYSGTLGQFISGVSGTFGCTNASSGVTGCLTGADWTTFNAKQPAGNYITALTGDVTASGPGSAAATLATVNGNVGSFTNSSITVNGKGLITAASSGAAPEVPLTFTYPLVRTVNTISTVLVTTTSQTWAGTQTFTNTPTVTAFSSAGTVNNLATGALYSTPTSTPSVTSPITYSGTLGSLLGGVSGTFACATCVTTATASSTITGTQGQTVYMQGTNSPIGTSSIFTTTAGRVGIGTLTPAAVNASAMLTAANTGATDIVASTTDNTTLSTAILESYAPGSRVFIGAHGTNQVTTQYGITVGGWGELGAINSSFGTSNGLLIGTRTTATPIVFGTNSTERMRITDQGAVGIGTLTPAAKLDVQGTTTDATGQIADFWKSDGTTAVRIRNDGNVGIGTTSPWRTLSVQGPLVVNSPNTYSLIGDTLGATAIFGLTNNDTLVVSTSTTGTANARAMSINTLYSGSTAGVIIQGFNSGSSWGPLTTVDSTAAIAGGGGVRGGRYITRNDSIGHNILNASAVTAQNILAGTAASTTNAMAFNSEVPSINATGLVTNYYDFIAQGGAVTGTLTNHYGFTCNNMVSGTNRYCINQLGATDLNYFAGSVGLATTSPFARLSVDSSSLSAGIPAFAIGSTTVTDFIVTQGHKVGIGTNAPIDTLDVTAIAGAAAEIFHTSTSGATATDGFEFSLGPAPGNGAFFWNYEDGGINFASNNTLRMVISNRGLFGLNVAAPVNQFDLALPTIATAKTADFAGALITNTATSTTSSLIKSGVRISSTGAWSGTSDSNIGLYVASVTGGTNNYDAVFNGGGTVGIGTTSPYATLSIQSGASTGDAFVVATSSTKMIGGYDNDGHRFTGGPAPAITLCGTGSGTVVGDDQNGTITTATAATTCTATFAKAYQGTPTCTVTDNSLVGFADVSAISTTAVTFGISSALTGGLLFYQCSYHRN